MNKLKILFCIEYLDTGGTEKQLISLIDGLNGECFQPYLCCLRNTMIGNQRRKQAIDLFNAIECPKIQLDFISLNKISSWVHLIRLAQFIRKHNIDIVQTYFQDPTMLGLIAARLSGVKHVVANFRDLGFWRYRDNDRKMRIVYRFCSSYIANSRAVKEFYADNYKLIKDNIKIIYNGIDIKPFTRIRRKDSSRTKDIIIGIVANFNREVKRLDVFLKAASYVLQQKDDVQFIIAGEGELKEDLLKLSMQLGINENVTFLGRVKDIPELLTRIDIGVNSSDSEGFSNSILEYMAARLPVVATDVGGTREIIINGVNGFLVKPGDYKTMGERIVALISDETLYNKISDAAYITIENNYSLRACIKTYENYYNELMI